MSRTLEDLERSVWPDPGDTTPMIKECHRLRKLPIRELTAAQLGLLIRQQIGGRHLIDEAIMRLESDPLLDSGMTAGDLLWSVLRADDQQFRRWPATHQQLKAIASTAHLQLSDLPEDVQVHYQLRTEIERYVR